MNQNIGKAAPQAKPDDPFLYCIIRISCHGNLWYGRYGDAPPANAGKGNGRELACSIFGG